MLYRPHSQAIRQKSNDIKDLKSKSKKLSNKHYKDYVKRLIENNPHHIDHQQKKLKIDSLSTNRTELRQKLQRKMCEQDKQMFRSGVVRFIKPRLSEKDYKRFKKLFQIFSKIQKLKQEIISLSFASSKYIKQTSSLYQSQKIKQLKQSLLKIQLQQQKILLQIQNEGKQNQYQHLFSLQKVMNKYNDNMYVKNENPTNQRYLSKDDKVGLVQRNFGNIQSYNANFIEKKNEDKQLVQIDKKFQIQSSCEQPSLSQINAQSSNQQLFMLQCSYMKKLTDIIQNLKIDSKSIKKDKMQQTLNQYSNKNQNQSSQQILIKQTKSNNVPKIQSMLQKMYIQIKDFIHTKQSTINFIFDNLNKLNLINHPTMKAQQKQKQNFLSNHRSVVNFSQIQQIQNQSHFKSIKSDQNYQNENNSKANENQNNKSQNLTKNHNQSQHQHSSYIKTKNKVQKTSFSKLLKQLQEDLFQLRQSSGTKQRNNQLARCVLTTNKDLQRSQQQIQKYIKQTEKYIKQIQRLEKELQKSNKEILDKQKANQKLESANIKNKQELQHCLIIKKENQLLLRKNQKLEKQIREMKSANNALGSYKSQKNLMNNQMLRSQKNGNPVFRQQKLNRQNLALQEQVRILSNQNQKLLQQIRILKIKSQQNHHLDNHLQRQNQNEQSQLHSRSLMQINLPLNLNLLSSNKTNLQKNIYLHKNMHKNQNNFHPRVNQNENNHNNLHQNNSNTNQQNEQLQQASKTTNNLTEKTSHNQQHSLIYKQQQKKNRKLTDQINSLKENNEKLKEQNIKITAENEILFKQNQILLQQNQKIIQQKQLIVQKNNVLMQQSNDMKKQLEQASVVKQINISLQVVIKSLQNRHKQLVSKTEVQTQSKRLQIVELNQKIQNLQLQKETKSDQIIQLNQQNKELKQGIQKKQFQIQQFRKMLIEGQKQRIKYEQNHNSTKNQQKIQLQKKIKLAEQNYQAKKKQLLELRNNYKIRQKQLIDLKLDYQLKNQQLALTKQNYETIKNDYQYSNRQLLLAKQDYSKLQQTYNTLLEQKNQLLQKCDSLQSQHKRLQQNQNQGRQDNKYTPKKLNQLKQQNKTLSQNKLIFNQQKRESQTIKLSEQLKRLEQQFQYLVKEKLDIQKQYYQLSQDFQQLSQSSKKYKEKTSSTIQQVVQNLAQLKQENLWQKKEMQKMQIQTKQIISNYSYEYNHLLSTYRNIHIIPHHRQLVQSQVRQLDLSLINQLEFSDQNPQLIKQFANEQTQIVSQLQNQCFIIQKQLHHAMYELNAYKQQYHSILIQNELLKKYHSQDIQKIKLMETKLRDSSIIGQRGRPLLYKAQNRRITSNLINVQVRYNEQIRKINDQKFSNNKFNKGMNTGLEFKNNFKSSPYNWKSSINRKDTNVQGVQVSSWEQSISNMNLKINSQVLNQSVLANALNTRKKELIESSTQTISQELYYRIDQKTQTDQQNKQMVQLNQAKANSMRQFQMNKLKINCELFSIHLRPQNQNKCQVKRQQNNNQIMSNNQIRSLKFQDWIKQLELQTQQQTSDFRKFCIENIISNANAVKNHKDHKKRRNTERQKENQRIQKKKIQANNINMKKPIHLDQMINGKNKISRQNKHEQGCINRKMVQKYAKNQSKYTYMMIDASGMNKNGSRPHLNNKTNSIQPMTHKNKSLDKEEQINNKYMSDCSKIKASQINSNKSMDMSDKDDQSFDLCII